MRKKCWSCNVTVIWDICTSTQGTSFHGSSKHMEHLQTDITYRRTYLNNASPEERQKSVTESRKEEIEKPKEPEVLLLVLEVTVVTGQYRMQHKSSVIFDKGSRCSMISKDLVAKLRLEPLTEKIIIKSEEINTGFVVVALLKEDSTIA
jgi:hypothetical protein